MELCILCFFFFFLCFKLFYGKFFAMPPPHTREKKKTLVNYKPVLPVCIHQHGTPLCTFIKHWKVLFLVNLITFFPCPIDFWESKKKKKQLCLFPSIWKGLNFADFVSVIDGLVSYLCIQQRFHIFSIHPFLPAHQGLGHKGSSLSKDAQTFLSPATSLSFSGGIPRLSLAS